MASRPTIRIVSAVVLVLTLVGCRRQPAQSRAEPAPPAAQGALSANDNSKVERLVAELKSDNDAIRIAAAEELARLGPAAKAAVPALVQALRDSRDAVCIESLRALGAIGPDATSAIPAILSMMTETVGRADAPKCGGVALTEVPRMGSACVPFVIGALGTADDESAMDLLVALDGMAVSALATLLEQDGRAGAAMTALTRMALRDPKTVAPVVPAIRQAYRRRKIGTSEFLSAVSAMGAVAVEAAPETAEALRDADSSLRVAAVDALTAIGAAAPGVVAPSLAAALRDSSSVVRLHAAQALGGLGAGAREAVTALAAALRDPDNVVRVAALLGLGKIGREARDAVPAIKALRADPSIDTRLVDDVLQKIEGA